MKRTKRIFAIFMTLALAMSMLIVSSAVSFADETTNTLTINGAKKGHTYTAYQVLSGTVEAGDSTATPATNDQLKNIQWGNGVSDTFKTAKGNAAAFAETLQAESDAKNLAKEIATTNGYLGTAAGAATASADGPVQITGLADGYYVIIDTAGDGVSATNDAYSQYLVYLVKSTTIDTKLDVPSVEKKVKDNDYDKNDGAQKTGVEVGTGYNDAADWNIGDTVPFELFGTLPSNYGEYEKYKYTFTDTASAGLDIDQSSVKVFVDNTELESGFTVTVPADKHSLVVDFANLKTAAPNATSSSKVKVTFNATLNKNAVIGLDGNPNKVDLTFSNNPTDGGEGTSKTPEDEVLVFTYELDVTKVDGADNTVKLANAQFVLKNSDNKYAKIDANGKVDGWLDTKPGVKTAAAEDGNFTAAEITPAAADGVLISNGTGDFKIVGLDAGTYTLEEIKAPAGYNKCDDLTLEIKASQKNLQNYKDADTVDAPNEVLTALSLDITQNGKKTTAEGDTDTGVVATTVANNSGAELPETGGIGTVIFYVLGSLLVVGCGIVLISKRRMESR